MKTGTVRTDCNYYKSETKNTHLPEVNNTLDILDSQYTKPSLKEWCEHENSPRMKNENGILDCSECSLR